MSWFQKKVTEPSTKPNASAARTAAAKNLKIAPLLDQSVVLFPAATLDKTAVLEALVDAVCRRAGISAPGLFLAKAQEREQGISTTLDTGLSLPHARIDGIETILAGMAVLKTPVIDPKQTDLPIRVVFLFFSLNKQEAFPLHLQLLRGVSSLFQPELIDQLTTAAGPAEAIALVRKIEG
jgi:PTS system nitrogen regulatory IIA component